MKAVIVNGDTFTLDVPVYRKWWQFWRPRIVGQVRRTFRVTHTNVAADR